jgi:hypothetical protein
MGSAIEQRQRDVMVRGPIPRRRQQFEQDSLRSAAFERVDHKQYFAAAHGMFSGKLRRRIALGA